MARRRRGNLLDHLGIAPRRRDGLFDGRAHCRASWRCSVPSSCARWCWAALGAHLVEGVGLPIGIAEAMEAASLEDLNDPMQRMFRAFADQTAATAPLSPPASGDRARR